MAILLVTENSAETEMDKYQEVTESTMRRYMKIAKRRLRMRLLKPTIVKMEGKQALESPLPLPPSAIGLTGVLMKPQR